MLLSLPPETRAHFTVFWLQLLGCYLVHILDQAFVEDEPTNYYKMFVDCHITSNPLEVSGYP